MQQSYYLSPLGCLKINQQGKVVTQIEWQDTPHQLKELHDGPVKQWLDGYFAGQCNATIPFEFQPSGTLFQQRVWRQMSHIPCGATLTYGEIAKKLRTSAQAVGNACRTNPIAVIIPCHRVLSASGNGGYAGQTQGIMMKRKLGMLALEVGVDSAKITLDE